MVYQIEKYQQSLFNKLFATLPSIRKATEFNKEFNLDVNVSHFYYFKNKDFWFTRAKKEDKYIFLFGIKDKPIKDICGNDACLIIDFDDSTQFNDSSLGLFSIKNGEIHILINHTILKEKYPYINTDLNIINYKTFDNSLDLEVIDLGNLDDEFIDNLEKLIKVAFAIKSKNNAFLQNKNKDTNLQDAKKDSDHCKICSNKISNSKIDSKLKNLKNIKPELCGNCIEKIVASEFFTKISPLLKSNDAKEINIAKKKFGNDSLFGIGFELLEKYKIIKFIGIKKLFYVIDRDSYLVKEYIKYSDENNLLINYIGNVQKTKSKQIEEELSVEKEDENPLIPKVVKNDSVENKNTISKMNKILEELAKGKNEEEAIFIANISKDNYNYWINRGKHDFGYLYVQFYNNVKELKLKQQEISSNGVISEEKENEPFVDEGIYEPLLEEYEKSFSSMNQSGIAWVNKAESKWTYSREINGKKIILSAHTIYELYQQVINQDLIWGIRDYNKAKKILDIPENFEIPNREIEDEVDKIDLSIYDPLSDEYEKSFSSMNQSGIAWVNQVGNKLYYMRSIGGKSIRLSGKNIYELYNNVKNANQIWGIRDYSKARKFIDFPDDFEIPEKQENEEDEIVLDNEINDSIYAPLSREHLSKFNPNPNNKTGIAWVNKIGNNWIYQRQRNGKTIKISDTNIIKLHEKVIDNNQIWGIFDIEKAKYVIENNSIGYHQGRKPPIVKPIIIDSNVSVNYIEKSRNQCEILIEGVVKNKDLIRVLSRFDLFKENIKRIITTSINDESDIFIKLEMGKYFLSDFEDNIEDLGWKINRK